MADQARPNIFMNCEDFVVMSRLNGLTQFAKSIVGTGPKGDKAIQTKPQEPILAVQPDLSGGYTHEDVAAWQTVPVQTRAGWNWQRVRRLLITYQTLCDTPTPFGAKRKRPLVYLHVPKAGGTTLEYLIAKNYAVGDTLYAHGNELMKNPALLSKVGVKGAVPRYLMGHYDLAQPIYQALNRAFVHITVLREPVSRVISWYNFLRSDRKHRFHNLATACSFEDFIDSVEVADQIRELDNAQTLRLTYGLHLGLLKRPEAAAETLRIAKDNLLNCFSFFGLQDRYVEFLLMTSQLLGWSDIFHQRRMVSKQQVKISDLDDLTIQKIRERNAYDIELYEFAKNIFEERCQKLGITQDNIDRFKQANAQYLELLSSALWKPAAPKLD